MISLVRFHLDKNKNLIKDNLNLFVTMFLAYIINYFFHFYVGRKLGPEDYGVFGVLLSIVYIVVMPLMAIQTTLSKYVAELYVKNEKEKLSYLFLRSLKNIGILGIIISILFIIVSPLLSSFLRINVISPLIILGSSIMFAFLVPIIRGFLQGMQKFKLLGSTFIIESLSKIFIGMPLIFFCFLFFIAAVVFSFVLPLILFIYFIKIGFFKEKKIKFNTSQIYKYSFPVFLMLIALTGLYA